VPMEPNEKGEETLHCRSCMKAKVALNKRRKEFVRNWKDYGKDVVQSIKARQRKSPDIEENLHMKDDNVWKPTKHFLDLPKNRNDWTPEDWSIYLSSLRHEPKKFKRVNKALAKLWVQDPPK